MRACSISGLCRLSAISRQGYYQKRADREHQNGEQAEVLQWVKQQRQQHPRMGARKLLHEMKEQGIDADLQIGRDRLFKLLAKNDLLIKPKKRSTRTTYSDHSLPVYRNLLMDREPTVPNQAWVSDITYIDTVEGFMYLSLITDLYSRKIVGWNLGGSLQASESIKALLMAIEQLPANCWPIHHSDRGSQYCCHEYVQVLNGRGLSISMTEQNHCYENAHAERINGILKDEYYLDQCFRTKAQAIQATEQAIDLYNQKRPHCSLNLRKPSQVHAMAA